VVDFGGFKAAPLQNLDKGRDQELVFNKKPETLSIVNNIPVKEVVFVNSNAANNIGNVNFKPLEKTSQQLKEE
jgi:hypothetical protein